MMSPGFFETFKKYLSQFRNAERKEIFREFLIALAEWRITPVVLVMMKEGFYDFGCLTPRYFSLSMYSPESEREERCNPQAWEWKYYQAYEKLYHVYRQMGTHIPKRRATDILYA